jgi:hypothetical protein
MPSVAAAGVAKPADVIAHAPGAKMRHPGASPVAPSVAVPDAGQPRPAGAAEPDAPVAEPVADTSPSRSRAERPAPDDDFDLSAMLAQFAPPAPSRDRIARPELPVTLRDLLAAPDARSAEPQGQVFAQPPPDRDAHRPSAAPPTEVPAATTPRTNAPSPERSALASASAFAKRGQVAAAPADTAPTVARSVSDVAAPTALPELLAISSQPAVTGPTAPAEGADAAAPAEPDNALSPPVALPEAGRERGARVSAASPQPVNALTPEREKSEPKPVDRPRNEPVATVAPTPTRAVATEAAAAPEAPRTAAPAERAQRVLDAVKLQVERTDKVAEIEVGQGAESIRATIRVEDHRVTVHFVTADPAVRTRLEAGFGGLARDLAQRGFELDRGASRAVAPDQAQKSAVVVATASARSGDEATSGGGGGWGRGERHPDGPKGRRDDDDDEAPKPGTARRTKVGRAYLT